LVKLDAIHLSQNIIFNVKENILKKLLSNGHFKAIYRMHFGYEKDTECNHIFRGHDYLKMFSVYGIESVNRRKYKFGVIQ